MLPFQRYYGFGEGFSFQGIGSTKIDGGGSSLSSRSTAEMKSVAACKSHSEAERRRRERINGHLARLRTLLPNLTKRDKASLLAEVVQHVKELKRHAADVAATDIPGNSTSNIWPFPSETDEVTLDMDPRSSLIKASVCCDDRPGLLSDLNDALRSLRLRAVKAEIVTLGGRTKSIFLIERGSGKGEDDEYHRLSIRRALKAVLDKPAHSATSPSLTSASSPAMLLGNKRPRLSPHLNINDF
ncbi:transcription factor bHLH30-like [Magnolia sinica]|uniref:transcription factor bHLH30-like n=1 Tax=Magnolia sinica TaxID=86752 RepID=UPI00265AE74C|nr:transcription factor bHLH30-like [Magnolia sinica]